MDVRFSRLGLGCATFGREIDEAAAGVLMDHAITREVNHFDLAAAYAKGESERIVGRWLADRKPAPGTIFLSTKMLPPFTPDTVRASVENSLKALCVDAIDIFYFHKWDDSAADPQVLAMLDDLVRVGKIRSLGASNFTAAQFARVLDMQVAGGWARFQALQNNNNFAVRHIDDAYRAFCVKNDVVIFTFSPLGSGFLTGKHQTGVVAGSRFDLVPNNQNIYFTEEAYRRLARLEHVSARSGLSKVQLALMWAVNQPGIAAMLVGGRTPAHLDQAFDAMALDRSDLLDELAAEP